MRWLNGNTDAMDKNLGTRALREMVRTGRPGVLQSMGLQRVGHDWATEQLLYFSEVLLSNIPAWHQVLTFLMVTWPIAPPLEATTWLSVIFKNEKLLSGGKAASLL